MDKKELLKIAQEEVNKVKELLGVEAEVKYDIEEGKEEGYIVMVTFEGEELGYMIGNRGKHLLALQYILTSIIRNVVRKMNEEIKVNVVVDIAGYRKQRDERIEKIALQKADDARILGEPVELLPMSASERRVVHMTLSKFDDIKTESEGEGSERFVKIIPISEKDLGVVSGKESNEDEEE